jgi:hypothetical protein
VFKIFFKKKRPRGGRGEREVVRGRRGEMTQTLYAHINKIKKERKKKGLDLRLCIPLSHSLCDLGRSFAQTIVFHYE